MAIRGCPTSPEAFLGLSMRSVFADRCPPRPHLSGDDPANPALGASTQTRVGPLSRGSIR